MRLDTECCSVTNEGVSEIIGPFPVPSPRDKRERNDDPGQKRRGHRYSVHPSNHTISIDYPDRRSVNYLDHSHTDANAYADYNGSGSLTMRYLDGLAVDQLLARTDPSANTAWYITDQLGTVEDIVNSGAGVIDHILYDSFGNITSESSPSSGDRFKFAGMEYDATTGIYYDRARYYDPNTGRFVSQDPMGFAAGDANLYLYVANSPTASTDPTGHIQVIFKRRGRIVSVVPITGPGDIILIIHRSIPFPVIIDPINVTVLLPLNPLLPSLPIISFPTRLLPDPLIIGI